MMSECWRWVASSAGFVSAIGYTMMHDVGPQIDCWNVSLHRPVVVVVVLFLRSIVSLATN